MSESHLQLRRLIEAMPELMGELDLKTLLQRVLSTACALTGARYAAVGILDKDRRELERFLTRGIDDARREEIGDLPRGLGVLGVLIEDPVPLRLEDVGSHPSSYGFPPGHPPMSTFLGVPIKIRGQAWGNLYMAEKLTGQFTEADEEASVLLAGWVGIAVDNARLYERRRAGEAEQAMRGLRATTEIAKAIGGETELERVLELIAKRGRALVQAGSLSIALREDDELVVRAAAGRYLPELVDARVPLEGSVGGQVLKGRQPRRLADIGAQLRFVLRGIVDARGGLVVPLHYRGRGVGVLYAFDRQVDGPEFSRDDELLLESFAASAATAVATAQEFTAHGLRRSIESSESERRRWARELHDQTLQDMAGIRLGLSAALRRDDGAHLATAATDAIERLNEGIAELRAIVTDLRPAALDEVGTKAALEILVERVGAAPDAPRIELAVDLAYEEGRSPTCHTTAVESALYRLVQEGLTNAVKHSPAGTIAVSVLEDGERVETVIRDDGKGFDPQASVDGFGLIGMRERLALVGGSLEITSRPGEGIGVRAVIPAVLRSYDAGLSAAG
jgi:signal transduction histidine kinase